MWNSFLLFWWLGLLWRTPLLKDLLWDEISTLCFLLSSQLEWWACSIIYTIPNNWKFSLSTQESNPLKKRVLFKPFGGFPPKTFTLQQNQMLSLIEKFLLSLQLLTMLLLFLWKVFKWASHLRPPQSGNFLSELCHIQWTATVLSG